jgi:hypothetical protein
VAPENIAKLEPDGNRNADVPEFEAEFPKVVLVAPEVLAMLLMLFVAVPKALAVEDLEANGVLVAVDILENVV